VGAEVGEEEGSLVEGQLVGFDVGILEGSKVGLAVGLAVGVIVGQVVGLSVDGPFKLQYVTAPFKLFATELHMDSLLDSVIPSTDISTLNSSLCGGVVGSSVWAYEIANSNAIINNLIMYTKLSYL